MPDESIIAAARLIREAKRIVAFTGAGISTESGVPDFRSPGGIWSQYNADDLTYQKFRSDEKYRKIYWAYDRARYPAMRDAVPNLAHKSLVDMERSGRLEALITQNIDGLHQKAGSLPQKVYELHGTVKEITCLDCHARWPREKITDEMDRDGVEVAYCKRCGGPLKCATIAFGQSLPGDVLEKSFYYARNCDLFLTIGSSLAVQPAASLPIEAKRGGARLILVNLSDTPYDQLMDVIIRSTAGPAMAEIIAELGPIADHAVN